jgi:hypothetical protein
MSRMSRDKGARGENEVAALVRVAGWPNASRNFASGARGHGDIAHGPALTVIESKFTDSFSIRACWAQVSRDAQQAGPGYLPVLAHRWSRGTWEDGRATPPWLGITELDELLALLQLRERS